MASTGELGALNCFRKEAAPAQLKAFSEGSAAYPEPAKMVAATPAAFAENRKVFTENEVVFTEYAAALTE